MTDLFIDNKGNLAYYDIQDNGETKKILYAEEAILQSLINDSQTVLLIRFIESFEDL